jgi:hypothetical protein
LRELLDRTLGDPHERGWGHRTVGCGDPMQAVASPVTARLEVIPESTKTPRRGMHGASLSRARLRQGQRGKGFASAHVPKVRTPTDTNRCSNDSGT